MCLRKGQIVRVEFLDHCEGGEPIRFVVYGEVGEIRRKYLCVDTWAYADGRQKHDANEERYTIVRSTVTDLKRLIEEPKTRKGAKAQRRA